MAKRIQRLRTKGWRMPEGAVYVGRPTKWGNHWTIKQYREAGYDVTDADARQTCIEAYRAWITGGTHWAFGGEVPPIPEISELRGKNLACWCKEGEPCHADILLELATE